MRRLDPVILPFPNLINIVPDTSWLLDSASSVSRPNQITGTDEREEVGIRTLLFSKVPNENCSFIGSLLGEEREHVQPYVVPHTWILLEEVLAEVTDLHAKAHDKREGTGHAKRLIREIMEKTDFERVQASHIELVPLVEGSLGIDSETDHRLLTVAIQRASTWKGGCSVVLTGDTGIALEGSSQNRENGHRIFTTASREHLKRIAAENLFRRHPDLESLYTREWCGRSDCFTREDFTTGPVSQIAISK